MDSDGTDAWCWVRDLAMRPHDGSWNSGWNTGKTTLNLFQRSSSGVLRSGEGSAQPPQRSFRLVANRVRGKTAAFATVLTIDGTTNVSVSDPVLGTDGVRSFLATVDGVKYCLGVDGKKHCVWLETVK